MERTLLLIALFVCAPLFSQEKGKEPLIDSQKAFTVAEDELDMLTPNEFKLMLRGEKPQGRDGVYKIQWKTSVKLTEYVTTGTLRYSNAAKIGDKHVLASFSYSKSFGLCPDIDFEPNIKVLEKFIKWSKTALENDVTDFAKDLGTWASHEWGYASESVMMNYSTKVKFVVDDKGNCFMRFGQDGHLLDDNEAVVLIPLLKKIKAWKDELEKKKKFDKLFED